MSNSLSTKETIHFKKDISSFIKYVDFLKVLIKEIDNKYYANNNLAYRIELNNLKSKLEKDIEFTNKRIEMLK